MGLSSDMTRVVCAGERERTQLMVVYECVIIPIIIVIVVTTRNSREPL